MSGFAFHLEVRLGFDLVSVEFIPFDVLIWRNESITSLAVYCFPSDAQMPMSTHACVRVLMCAQPHTVSEFEEIERLQAHQRVSEGIDHGLWR